MLKINVNKVTDVLSYQYLLKLVTVEGGQVHVNDVSCGSQQFKYAAHEGIISSIAYAACGQLFSDANDCKGIIKW